MYSEYKREGGRRYAISTPLLFNVEVKVRHLNYLIATQKQKMESSNCHPSWLMTISTTLKLPIFFPEDYTLKPPRLSSTAELLYTRHCNLYFELPADWTPTSIPVGNPSNQNASFTRLVYSFSKKLVTDGAQNDEHSFIHFKLYACVSKQKMEKILSQ